MFNIKQNLKEKPIENIKIGKFTNTALQLPSRHNINMLYWIPRSESTYLKKYIRDEPVVKHSPFGNFSYKSLESQLKYMQNI